MTRTIALSAPEVMPGEVRFRWSVTPETSLYRETSFALRFPPSVALAHVPEPLWWRVALLCLHAHWPLLRPCRIVLPVTLPDAEVETWLRLTDAAVATLEPDDAASPRTVSLVGDGLPVAPYPEPTARAGGIVSLFSGGRDSTTQAAMLLELGETPTLVTVTSPRAGSVEHETARRAQVLREMTRRTGAEVIEVRSDYRSIVENDFASPWGFAVSEMSDTLLFLAAATVVAAARGASLITIASEYEVHDNTRVHGHIVQHRHFMYAAPIIHAVSALLAPAGIAVSSLTYPLRQFQVQRLLAQRYENLRDLQYSCWSMSLDQAACSACAECRGIALNLLSFGIDPGTASIDLVTLLEASADWEPGVLSPRSSPVTGSSRAMRMQELRALSVITPEQVGTVIDGRVSAERRARALEIFATLRERAAQRELEPEPGYAGGYLELIHPRVRCGVRAIIEEHFDPAPPDTYAKQLANTRVLSRWLTAPLTRTRAPAPDREPHRHVRVGPAPPHPVTLDEHEFAALGPLIPAPEPSLRERPDGRVIPVADTMLDGRELKYVTECVETNWISSAGSFVTRFEDAFAHATDCRYAIACSSGTAALHLALAAAGITAEDEVIVPAFTMIGTANAVRYLGARPVLVDADPLSWNLDPDRVAAKLTPRTRAILNVHIYGQPADMDALRDLAERNGLVLVEDAAEAHGADIGGRPVGSLGDVAAFSMYGNKIVTSGEGGVVTTNDERLAEVARSLRGHAFSTERHFWHRRLGFNYRITNLQAAVALAQTERLPELIARRRQNAERYRAALAGIDGLGLPPSLPGGVTWMFGVTVSDALGITRDELRYRLADRGIETRTFFVPMHLQPIYREAFRGQRYPVAEWLGAAGLYLPSGPGLTDEDIAYVADTVRAVVQAAGSPSSV